MTSAEITELREFISGELQRVHRGMGELRADLASLATRVDGMHIVIP